MIKCGICNKEFEDNQFDEYAAHVKECAYDAKMKSDIDRMKKINEELQEVKRAKENYETAKTCYEGLRDTFKKKYPDIYKANFKDEDKDEFVDDYDDDYDNGREVSFLDFLNSII